MKKKIIILATVFTMLLTGCGSNNESSSNENHLNWNTNEISTQAATNKTNTTEHKIDDNFDAFYKNLPDDLFDFYVNNKKYSINKTICQKLIDDGVLSGSEITSFDYSLNNVNTIGIPDEVNIDEVKGKFHVNISMKISKKPIKDNIITNISYYIDDPNSIQLSTKVKLNLPFIIEDILYSPDIIKQHLGEPTSADTYNNTTTYSYDNMKELKSISFTYKDGTLNEILISIL